ncbi:MAG: ABC transporter substrate-binding protein [Treponema sp. CETP13]|nr:MAG: ABC transporter substrate-binding protein [Treponema sp. CETP13]
MKKILAFLLPTILIATLLSCSAKSETKEATASSSNTLNIMVEVEVQSLDPQVATDGTSFEVIADFTDGLKQMAADGSVVNALCESESISADGKTYTFKIRDDANWSNGTPVTAADFVFGWRRAADPALASEYSYMMSDIGQIKNAAAVEDGSMPVDQLGVKALDAKTLQVELEVPVSYFDQLLYFPTFYPVNEEFFNKCGDTYATNADTLLSNGAFIMTDYQPAATNFKLVKNPNYYDAAKVALDGLNYQVIKDSQQALMSYQNGDLDIIQLSGDQVDQVKDDPEYKSIGAGYLWYISPNIATSPELANLNMRKAITFALDRETIVESVVKDGSLASYAPVPSEFAYNSKGEDFTQNTTEYADVCAFDTTKALAFFNEAKKELGQDTFEFEMILDDTSIQQNVAAVIKEEIESTLPGITIDLKVEPKKQRVQDMQDGNFTLGLTRWGPDYADPMTYLGMWFTDNSNNYGLWSNKEYDSILTECTTGDLSTDLEGRWAALKEAEAIVMKECVIMPLYQQANADMIKPNVTGIEFHPIALNRVFKETIKK